MGVTTTIPGVSTLVPAQSDAESTPRVRGAGLWAALAAGWFALFLVRVTYYVFHDVADGMMHNVPRRMFEEVTGALTAVPVILISLWVARRAPFAPGRSMRSLALIVASFLILSPLHTEAMVLVRALLGPSLDYADYPFRVSLSRYAYEMANDVLPWAVFYAGYALADNLIARRDRERRALGLERAALESELRALRLQLQPHFLFNALNTISDAIYDDPARADALLGHLAELLRTSLRTTHAHEVSVRDEVALVEQYLALMRARFGDRLRVTVRVAPDAERLRVPSMILQPLVENAIRHGGVAEAGRGCVEVDVARVGDRLAIHVRDDGPGRRDEPGTADASGGTGLSATARRLALLYGEAHELEAGDAPGGGFAVRIAIPAREADG